MPNPNHVKTYDNDTDGVPYAVVCSCGWEYSPNGHPQQTAITRSTAIDLEVFKHDAANP